MHSRATTYVVAIALVIATAGCYQKTVTMQRMGDSSSRTWIGEPVASVFAVWGPQNSPESDGHGGKVYVYRKSADARLSTDAPGIGSPGDSDINRMSEKAARDDRRDGNLSEDARFWTDPSGKVYRYWFSDDVWKSKPEKTKPPPTTSTPPDEGAGSPTPSR